MQTLTHELVKQEIHNWITNYLDVPSEHFNGHQPCPFALPAWNADRVEIKVGAWASVLWSIDAFDDKKDLVIIAVPEGSYDGLEPFCEAKNQRLADQGIDLICIPFIPSSEGEEDPDIDPEAWGAITDHVYGMVFIQRLSTLNKVSRMLEREGYYENVSEEFWKYITSRRELEAQHGRQEEVNG